MKIFSKHRKKMEPKRRFGGMEFRSKIKEASNYKRAFHPTGVFSLNFLPGNSRWLRVAKITGTLGFLLAVYYFVISPALLVTDYEIKGNRQVSADQIRETLQASGNQRLFLIPKANYFLMSQGRVNHLLTSTFPTIKTVLHYNRQWPHKAVIEISERTPGFVIKTNNNYFLIDSEGLVVDQIENPQKLLVVEDQLDESFSHGDSLPNQKLAPFILSMSKSWSTKVNIPIVSIKFPGKSSNEVQFETSMGWSVLFDTGRSVTVQLSDLAVILSKQIKPSELPQLAYIDLRLNKWAYYCFKASPCSSKEIPVEAGASITNTNEQ